MGTSASELVSLDPASGEVSARLPVPAGLTMQPIVASGLLLASTDDATLLALSGGA